MCVLYVYTSDHLIYTPESKHFGKIITIIIITVEVGTCSTRVMSKYNNNVGRVLRFLLYNNKLSGWKYERPRIFHFFATYMNRQRLQKSFRWRSADFLNLNNQHIPNRVLFELNPSHLNSIPYKARFKIILSSFESL